MIRKSMLIVTLLALLALTLPGALAQDSTPEATPEAGITFFPDADLTQTYELSGVFTVNYPTDWNAVDNGSTALIANADFQLLQGLSDIPTGLVFSQVGLIPADSVASTGVDAPQSPADIINLITGGTSDWGTVEDTTAGDLKAAVVRGSSNGLDVIILSADLGRSLYGVVYLGTPPGELDAHEAVAYDMLQSLTPTITSDITDEALARYQDIPQSTSEEGFPQLGSADAPAHLTEYSSFACPHCLEFHEGVGLALVDRIRSDEVQFTYVPLYNIGSLPNSEAATRAALCAGEQGKFWEYHDALFSWQPYGEMAFIEARFQQAAEDLNLDMEAWNACLASDRPDAILQAASDSMDAQGVTGTPTVFINGSPIPAAADTINTQIDNLVSGSGS